MPSIKTRKSNKRNGAPKKPGRKNDEQRRLGFKHPRFKNDLQEFPRGAKGLIFCSDCGAVYRKKSWRHSLLNVKPPKISSQVGFKLCPACKMIRNNQFEGEVTIVNVPTKLKAELNNFIKGYCLRAYQRDPMDRLIKIKNEGNSVIVTVTENQLANKLGKKIKNLFNNTKVKTTFAEIPKDVSRVRVEFTK